MKTAQEFEQSAKQNNIKRWNIHDCSMCGYQCGFVIENDDVFYDSGCDCVFNPYRLSSYDEIAQHYNGNVDWMNDKRNEHPELTKKAIEKMDKFWHFSI